MIEEVFPAREQLWVIRMPASTNVEIAAMMQRARAESKVGQAVHTRRKLRWDRGVCGDATPPRPDNTNNKVKRRLT